MAKSITHVTFSTQGGAGRVAVLLNEGQKKLGVESRIIAMTDSNLYRKPLKNPLQTIAAATDNFLIRERNFPAMVSITRSLLNGASKQLFSLADILHLHWMPGVADTETLVSLSQGKKVVWTLHDMNPLTGGCHQSMGCDNFTRDCENCPAVKRFAEPAVRSALKKKSTLYPKFSDLVLVAPTPWMAQQAMKSSVFQGREVKTIPNPVERSFFKTADFRKHSKISPQFILVAMDHADPLKNVEFAISVFTEFRKIRPEFRLQLVGPNASKFRSRPGVTCEDYVSKNELPLYLSNSVGLLVPSLAEASSLVAVEAAAAGTTFIGNDIPALRDIAAWLGDGLLATTPAEWVAAMLKVTDNWDSGHLLKQRIAVSSNCRDIFGEESVLSKYQEVYEE